MAIIPVNMNSAKFKLDDTMFAIGEFTYKPDDFVRDYCGMSGLGNPCMRAIQYSCFRASKDKIEPRTQRIFDMGHILEEYIVQALINSGIEVTDQQKEVIGFAGHWRGHIDGIAHNVPEATKTPHLLEIKTHNDKNFKKVVKEGVQASYPGYYAQTQRYMGGLDLTRALYVGYNKNDSMYYIERIPYDKGYADDLVRKETDALLSEALFPRIGNGKITWFECSWCVHKQVCYNKKEPEINCRTCNHVDMHNDGIWKCGIDNTTLDYKAQMAACKMYMKSNLFNTA